MKGHGTVSVLFRERFNRWGLAKIGSGREQEESVVDAVFVDGAIRWEQRRTTSGWTVAGRAGKTYEDERGRFALNCMIQCETASFDGTRSDGMQARKRREKGVLSSIFGFRGR